MPKRGADQNPKNRNTLPHESDLDRHARDYCMLGPLQPAPNHQPEEQLPSIRDIGLLTSRPSGNLLEGHQHARGPGNPLRAWERDRQEAREREAQEQHRRAQHEKDQAAERYRSEHATPLIRESAGSDIPWGPADINPNSHKQMARGQSEQKRHQVQQREAQEQQYQSFHQGREAAQRYPSERAPPQTRESAGSDVAFRPTGIIPYNQKEISEADKKIFFKMKSRYQRVTYEMLARAVNYRHDPREIESYMERPKCRGAEAERRQRKKQMSMVGHEGQKSLRRLAPNTMGTRM